MNALLAVICGSLIQEPGLPLPEPPPILIAVADDGAILTEPCVDGNLYAPWKAIRDWIVARQIPAAVHVPAGEFTTTAALEILDECRYRGRGRFSTIVRPADPATHRNAVFFAYTEGWHTTYRAPRADNWTFEGIGIDVRNADSAPAVHGLNASRSSRCLVRDVAVWNCRREGLILNGDYNCVIEYEADLCGTGSANRATTSSALNMGGARLVVVRPRIRRSGQGMEFSGRDSVVVGADIAQAPALADWEPAALAAAPSLPGSAIGYHVGSDNNGAGGVVVVGLDVAHYPTGVLAGNGNGCFGSATFVRTHCYNAPLRLAGSRPSNLLESPVPDLHARNGKNYWIDATLESSSSEAQTFVNADAAAAEIGVETQFLGLTLKQAGFVSAQATRPFVKVSRWGRGFDCQGVELRLDKRLPRPYAAFSYLDYTQAAPRPDIRLSGVVVLPSGNRIEATAEKETL